MQLPKPSLFTILLPAGCCQLLRHCCFFVLVLFFLNPLTAQNDTARVSSVFPTERRQELIKELDYSKQEEEEEEIIEDEEASKWLDWFNFGEYENWNIDLSDGTTIFILLLLLVGLGFFVYRMLGDVSLRKRARGEGEEEDEINIEDIEEEKLVAEGVSLTLLERAENAGQFDVAVRLLYIQLLKELQDGGLIKYRRDFSNRDYQNQLRKSIFLNDFREVTADYERYWYGKYPIERLGYRLVHRKFITLNAAIQAATAKPDNYV